MKFKVCPYCGSNLDPSERCDCQKEQERRGNQQVKATENHTEVLNTVMNGAGIETGGGDE